MIKILFFGDIVGKIGRKGLKKALSELKEKYQPDLVIANAENLAHGLGVTEKTLNEMLEAGVDFFTSGNHVWKKPMVEEIFAEDKIPLIRPANYPEETSGKGYKTLKVGGRKLIVLNLMGRVFIEEIELTCPFKKADEIIEECKKEKADIIIVDIHAEATSEKVAMGWYLDGRVAAVLGTHTHIPTADCQILPKGTAYVTDIGMVGAKDSVIGVDKEVIIENFLEEDHLPHEIPEEGDCIINSVLVEIEPKTNKATKIERIDLEVKI